MSEGPANWGSSGPPRVEPEPLRTGSPGSEVPGSESAQANGAAPGGFVAGCWGSEGPAPPGTRWPCMVRAWARGPGSPLGSSSWGGGAGGGGPAPGGAAASGSGGGAAGSAPLRRLEPPARAGASSCGSGGSSSSSRGHRRCRARHRRPWPQAGSGLRGAGGPLGSAVYDAAAAGQGSEGCTRRGLSTGLRATSVAPGRAASRIRVRGLFFLLKWESIWALLAGRKGFFLPPQRRLGAEKREGEGKGGKRGRRWPGGARVRRALRLRGSPSARPPDDAPAAGGRETAWAGLHRPLQPQPWSPQRRAGRSPGKGDGEAGARP